MRRRTSAWGLAVASTLVAVAVAELALRLAGFAPGFQPAPPDDLPGLWRADSLTNYSYAPGFTGVISRPYYTIQMRINGLGMRERPLELSAKDAVRVLAVGNSFTVGWGVERHLAWPAALEAGLRALGHRVDVLNGGVSGYSLRQVRRHAVRLADTLQPALVVLGLYQDGWSRIQDPYILVGHGLLRQSAGANAVPVDGGWLVTEMWRPWMRAADLWLARHFYVGGYAFKAAYAAWEWSTALLRSDVDDGQRWPQDSVVNHDLAVLAFAELDTLVADLRGRGIPLAVLLVNGQEGDGTFNDRQARRNAMTAAFTAERGILLVDPLPALQRAAEGTPVLRLRDGHWSERAHQLAGQAAVQPVSPRLAGAAGPDLGR